MERSRNPLRTAPVVNSTKHAAADIFDGGGLLRANAVREMVPVSQGVSQRSCPMAEAYQSDQQLMNRSRMRQE
jgi:hypothetical protein